MSRIGKSIEIASRLVVIYDCDGFRKERRDRAIKYSASFGCNEMS
jgi:hypothetical protein